MLDQLGWLVHLEVGPEHRDAQRQPREIVIARPVLARVSVYRLDRAPVSANAHRLRRGAESDHRLEAVGGSCDALLYICGCIFGGKRARREPHPGRRRSGQAVDAKGSPVLPVSVPRDEVPAATVVEEGVRLDVATAASSIAAAVAEADALRVAAGRRDHGEMLGATVGPAAGDVTVAEPSARTRRRRCAGSTCSSLTSARTAVSSMPVTDARAAVRRPTAIAIASSSSRSSGGIALPARSRYPPAGPGSDSTG